MGLQTADLAKDPTSIVTSGGTAKSLTSIGNDAKTRQTFFDGTDFLTRSNLNFEVRLPRTDGGAPGGYTQQRSIVVLKSPKVLANDEKTFNTLTINVGYDPETTDAEKDTMLAYGAQILSDSDFSDFLKDQALG